MPFMSIPQNNPPVPPVQPPILPPPDDGINPPPPPPPFEIPIDDAAVKAVVNAHKIVTKEEAEYVGMRIVGDANLYVHGSGLPTFYYGPSNETAHSDVEWVSLDRLNSAASVYALAALQYCK